MPRTGALAVAALLLLATTPARAASVDQIFPHGGFETAGVIVTLSGDDGDETVTLERMDAGGWRPLHPLVRYDRHGFAGSVFGLAPGSETTLRVTLDDPDGVDGEATRTVTVRTRPDDGPPAPTRTVWVATDGRDEADAGAETDPHRSIGYALARAEPGDEIRVRAGTYGPVVLGDIAGTEGAPIVIRADDPDAMPVIDGEGSRPFSLERSAWIVLDGFEITGGGTDADGIGVRLHSSAHVTVRGCYVHDNGHWNVLITKSDMFPGGVTEGGYHVIEDNRIADTDAPDCAGPSNRACDGQTYYGVHLDNNPGAGHVIRRNELFGHVDDVVLCGDEGSGRSLAPDANVLALTGGAAGWTNHDTAFYDNVARDARDDALELDGICVNARVFRNRLSDAENPVSVAPALPGPYFFVRNVVTGTWGQAAFKMNTNGEPDVPIRNLLVYHNTFVRTDEGPLLNLWYAYPGGHVVPIRDLVFRNNLFASPGGQCTNALNEGDEHPSFDYDLWWSPTSSDRLFEWWDGADTQRYATFDAFVSATGQETHGVFAEPALDDDLVPTEGSPAVDAALVIEGINDDHAGDAPDIGAFERGGEPPPGVDAGVPASDAAVPADRDAGAVSVHDGSSTHDGGPGDGGGDGCGCRAAGRPRGAPLSWLALATAAWLVCRRRR